MNIFLPIAQMSLSIPVVIGVGGVVGLLSGLFGVRGGFLLMPLSEAQTKRYAATFIEAEAQDMTRETDRAQGTNATH